MKPVMTYAEKLRHPSWQKKRLQILERDNWACTICGSKVRNLQVHHLVYAKRDPWDYPDCVYQTLCDLCHEARQEQTDKIVDAIRISLAKVPTIRLIHAATKLCQNAMLEIDLES